MRADAVRNRERIVTQAVRLFAERGPDVPMCEIADAAGLGVGTLYRHFPDRRALALDIGLGALRDLADFARTAREREESAWAELRAVIRHCATLPLALAKSLTALLPDDENETQAELQHTVDTMLTDLIVRAQREGTLRADVPTPEVQRLLSTIICRPGARPDDYLTVVMLDGLRARPA
ncbi:TetR/AcrR family transcriptional regulator [Amycolatopsis sp. SID8362]|uniref:TetR/AcrR family transcriptional regulator n=1 Tax=Amycolatopsis sp. SID8362 TaxID=2690346 RepID=UPI00136E07AE|nr:TetR/AcrR family transcriptional regulator [Amycolatopsis sp. SID8362]NBH06415.1 TetR family transcriptional regulator [Amycolatopsis sp. SID8362]NED43113.1 TetR/AcrR family transcriptional regulator [Amycolatopsis sp. SID8362]